MARRDRVSPGCHRLTAPAAVENHPQLFVSEVRRPLDRECPGCGAQMRFEPPAFWPATGLLVANSPTRRDRAQCRTGGGQTASAGREITLLGEVAVYQSDSVDLGQRNRQAVDGT